MAKYDGQAADKNFFTWLLTKDKDIAPLASAILAKYWQKRKKQCMHQLIEDKGFSDGGCDHVRLRLQCLAFAARLRWSSALPGPWSIVDNKNLKCKSAALFSLRAFTEGRQRKVTSRLRKLVFSEWDLGWSQHVARAYCLDLHPVHVLVHFYKTNIELLDEVLRWTCCRPR